MNEEASKQLEIILKRLDTMQKSLDIAHQDRAILEDISIRVGSLEDKTGYLTERIDKMDRNTKADNKDVIESVLEVKDSLDSVEQQVKAISD